VKRFGLTILLFPTALAAQAGADSVARPISLADAVRLAQRNSPTTVQAAGTTRSNAAAVRTAYMSFIPSVSLSSGASKPSGNRLGEGNKLIAVNSTTSYTSGLTMNVDLFDGGNRFFRLKGLATRDVTQKHHLSGFCARSGWTRREARAGRMRWWNSAKSRWPGTPTPGCTPGRV